MIVNSIKYRLIIFILQTLSRRQCQAPKRVFFQRKLLEHALCLVFLLPFQWRKGFWNSFCSVSTASVCVCPLAISLLPPHYFTCGFFFLNFIHHSVTLSFQRQEKVSVCKTNIQKFLKKYTMKTLYSRCFHKHIFTSKELELNLTITGQQFPFWHQRLK